MVSFSGQRWAKGQKKTRCKEVGKWKGKAKTSNEKTKSKGTSPIKRAVFGPGGARKATRTKVESKPPQSCCQSWMLCESDATPKGQLVLRISLPSCGNSHKARPERRISFSELGYNLYKSIIWLTVTTCYCCFYIYKGFFSAVVYSQCAEEKKDQAWFEDGWGFVAWGSTSNGGGGDFPSPSKGRSYCELEHCLATIRNDITWVDLTQKPVLFQKVVQWFCVVNGQHLAPDIGGWRFISLHCQA